MSTEMDTRELAPPTTRLVTLPGVNLLPPEIALTRRLRRVQMQLAGGGVVAMILVVVLFLAALGSVGRAQEDLQAAQAERAVAQQQVDGLAHVRQTYLLVDQANGLLRTAAGKEVLWSTYFAELGPLLPPGAWLTRVTVGPATVAPAAPAAAVTPAAAPIATISFEGIALAHINVAAWLDSIALERGWDNAYFSKSEEKVVENRKAYGWSASVTVNAAALSGRYTKPVSVK